MRICFSCPMARPVFEPEVAGPFGGSEVRASIFAHGLAASHLDVRVVVQAHDRGGQRQHGALTLHYVRMPAPRLRTRDLSTWQKVCNSPWSVVKRCHRSLMKRLDPGQVTRRLRQQLELADADIYGCFGVHEHAAFVIRFAQEIGRPSVLFLASDTDLSENYLPTANSRNIYQQSHAACYEALKNATQIVVQTPAQQQRLASQFGRPSILIPNPIPRLAATGEAAGVREKSVLWVGRADCFSKRADLAIDVARRSPLNTFTFVMNRRDPQVYDALVRQMPPNVRVVPAVPYAEMGAMFDAASWLLNTSDAEGFPNTFLQAAQRGVPIASLNVDPGQMLSLHKCGVCAGGDLERLVNAIDPGKERDDEIAARRSAGPAYVRRFHDAEERCQQLKTMLLKCAQHQATSLAQKPSPCEREVAA